MKTSYLVAQLLLTTSAQFSDIKFKETQGNKTIKFTLESKGSYKDLVTDKIMKNHFVK